MTQVTPEELGLVPFNPQGMSEHQLLFLTAYYTKQLAGGGGASPYVLKTGDTIEGPLQFNTDVYTQYNWSSAGTAQTARPIRFTHPNGFESQILVQRNDAIDYAAIGMGHNYDLGTGRIDATLPASRFAFEYNFDQGGVFQHEFNWDVYTAAGVSNRVFAFDRAVDGSASGNAKIYTPVIIIPTVASVTSDSYTNSDGSVLQVYRTLTITKPATGASLKGTLNLPDNWTILNDVGATGAHDFAFRDGATNRIFFDASQAYFRGTYFAFTDGSTAEARQAFRIATTLASSANFIWGLVLAVTSPVAPNGFYGIQPSFTISSGTQVNACSLNIGAFNGTVTNETAILLGTSTIPTGNFAINSAFTRPSLFAGTLNSAKVTTYGAGTAYSLTATSAAVDMGTTDPVIVITPAGTYKLRAFVNIRFNAATFAAARTVTLKIRRTNNTAADIANTTVTLTVPVIAAATTGTFMTVSFPVVDYTTTNTTDSLTIFADIDVVPGAGSIDITQCWIRAD